MNTRILLSQIIVFIIICLNSFSSFGQNLLESRRSSPQTYIYQLKEAEVRKIYKKDIWEVDSSFFHSLVDSVHTDSLHLLDLTPGYYLKTYAEQNQQKFEIASIQAFDVKVLNNTSDLLIQVFDLSGKIRKDAEVKLRGSTLKFDEETQSFLKKKTNKKGLLKVTHQGTTSFYYLNRRHKNSRAKRFSRKLAYGTPLKYAWIPIRYVVKIPIDGTKSIIRRRPYGSIYYSYQFFRNMFQRVACGFDDYYCDDVANRFERKHSGFLVFNQPKYRPGDTLKFKAYILNKNKKPVNKTLKVSLGRYDKDLISRKITPYAPGAYHGEFVLDDSLDMTLDTYYEVKLEGKEHQLYREEGFRFEDYELSKNQLTLRADSDEQYYGKEFDIQVKGTDENDLNILDGRIELLLLPNPVAHYFDTKTFIPDTLYFLQEKLAAEGETQITIPDSLFPKVNMDYQLKVSMLNADNEVMTQSKTISYFYKKRKADFVLKKDSLELSVLENGKPQQTQGKLIALDNFGNEKEVYKGTLPTTIPIHPFFKSYELISDTLKASFAAHKEPSLLNGLSRRTRDSLFIQIDNPRKLLFSYHIYARNQEISRGYTDSLSFQSKAKPGLMYYISLQYVWGGKGHEKNLRIPYDAKHLNIRVNQPHLIAPGQEVPIEVEVLDAEGDPVEGVDVTAFGLTKKFKYTAPQLPYMGKPVKPKDQVNQFYVEQKNHSKGTRPLDYAHWKDLANLDQVEYYPFLYPGDSIYTYSYETENKETQFAPFVVSKGALQNVHVIYVDDRPVYFSWATTNLVYSFPIDSGYHRIRLRTFTKEIRIDSLYIKEGEKLILSLDEQKFQPKVYQYARTPLLSEGEQRSLYPYTIPYRNNFGEHLAFFADGRNIQFLGKTPNTYSRRQWAGPYSGMLNLEILDSTVTYFKHESFFEYEFLPGLMKMRGLDKKDYPSYLGNYTSSKNLTDQILTRSTMQAMWEEFQTNKRLTSRRYKNPGSTQSVNGRLEIELEGNKNQSSRLPLNILLVKENQLDVLRMYPGSTRLFQELPPGNYSLIFLYDKGFYQKNDSIQVQASGINYQKLILKDSLRKDSFGLEIDKMLDKLMDKPHPSAAEEVKELFEINQQYKKQFSFFGPKRIFRGVVTDEEGEPLIGATVKVIGTTIGGITNVEGYFEFEGPANKKQIDIRYLGFLTKTIPNPANGFLEVKLTEDNAVLEEIVVTGFSTQSRRNLTGAVSSISSNALENRTEAEIANILRGKATGVDITQASGLAGSGNNIIVRGYSSLTNFTNPLIVIDGIPINGPVNDISPELIQEMSILKNEAATSLYGSRGANGVILITTKNGEFLPAKSLNKGADYDDSFLEAASRANSLRTNFSDYAFWQPALTTDSEGKAKFTVVFPDDVTNWDTHILAMNGKRQSGQHSGSIKAYKPLMAKLAMPRFLVEGDTALAIGKVLNYLPDSVQVHTYFSIGTDTLTQRDRWVKDALIDSLQLLAKSDTLRATFSMEQADAFSDGERREIPVFRQGMEETYGAFRALDHDSTINLNFNPALGPVSFYARADILPSLEDELSSVINYTYNCNEQIASKLKALLLEQKIALYKGEDFSGEKKVKKMIQLLMRNRKTSGLWGWWKGSEENMYISYHVLEALTQARRQNYGIGNLQEAEIRTRLNWVLSSMDRVDLKTRILRLLKMLGAQNNFQSELGELENRTGLSLSQKLQIMELRQDFHLPIRKDSLKSWMDTTLFGNLYISQKGEKANLWSNEIQNTLMAYRLIQKDSSLHASYLPKMRNYFLEKRNTGNWRNTYESIQIMEAILPDFIGDSSELKAPMLKLEGAIDSSFTSFPVELELANTEDLTISKSGSFPVYITAYQKSWNPTPETRKNEFEISTSFKENPNGKLQAGKPSTLVAKVIIKESAEYVMINVPIPASCSYVDKPNNFRGEAHREYFKQETAIFCEKLAPGTYEFEIELMPRYTGTYTLNPAKVELMYFPTFFANNEKKTLKVQ